MLVHKAEPFPVECVVRGYLAGSGLKEYRATGKVCGIELPSGLTEGSKLDQPIFTPATKAQTGHDENITWAEMVSTVGQRGRPKDCATLAWSFTPRPAITRRDGASLSLTPSLSGAVRGNEIILIDEVLTPDSSRFWPQQGYQPGRPQPSFDKQFVRDYLESLHWNKQPPPPPLPPEVVGKTSEKYKQAYSLLTGQNLN